MVRIANVLIPEFKKLAHWLFYFSYYIYHGANEI